MNRERRVVVAILAVDDEALNTELMQRVFRNRNDVTLITASNGTDALQVLRDNNVDLMLVDQSMPNMSGVALVREAFAKGHKPVCVMVTAYPEMKEVLEAWEQGLVRYIVPKPWRAADLLQTIDRALSRLG